MTAPQTPLAAIRAILDYCEEDEGEDYERAVAEGDIAEDDPRHVYTHIVTVRAWLDDVTAKAAP